ncbi:hypothetical protein [Maribacter litoralis]|uniref:Anti-sigma factor n=1 Tax=Maribacter litoralis TaxID=2059726 RepID=A0A653NFB8_9FLAO|nr:hypothetical protein [Maribacter litoralis]VXB15523.1 conserved hypothetical protein [Maribacter litoralis]
METDKFEKHIKAKFQEREILPSENAWAKIASELKDDDAKKKPVYLWMGIAASIVVLLGVALFYFNGSAVSNELPTEIVDTEKENKLDDVIIKESLPFKSEEEVVEVSSESKTSVEKVKVEEPIVPKIQESKVLDDKIEVAVNQVPTNETIEILVPDEIIDSKVAAIMAQVNVLEQNSTVTDAEVDSLLKRAQDEILREKIFNKNKSVDAMALLTEVEDELDQSFRDQIFDSLKAGFIKVRTAVADRNN